MARLAERLRAEAEACPELISRSGNSSSNVTKAPLSAPFPAMALLSDPALDVRQYLEDLVRVAVGSAQQAEHMSSEAREASRKAQRGMAVLAGLGALGLLVGIVGFTASRSTNVRLSQVRDEVSALQHIQQQAQDHLADIAARTPDQGAGAGAARHPSFAAAVIVRPLPTLERPPDQVEVAEAPEATPRSSVAPAQPRLARIPRQSSSGYYTQPWPDSRPPPRRLYW